MSKLKGKFALLAAMLVLVWLFLPLIGCQPQSSGEITVRVIVTQDFGSELMLDEVVTAGNSSSAMDALQSVATVDTQYGGAFVKSINGVAGEAGKDWFFYVNGMSANAGPVDYKLHDGDIQHWDFHDWSFRQFVPAIIGDFPQPFSGGYQGRILPTIVVYAEGFEDAAQNLTTGLGELGVVDIRVQAAAGLSTEDKQHGNLILLGTEDFPLISELNGNYAELGLYIHFEDGRVATFNCQGDKAEYDSCGVIQATQNPWNPEGLGACENVVWMISGTDRAQTLNAVDVLINRYEEFRYACAAVTSGGEVVRVPVPAHISKWPSWIGIGIVVALLITLIILLVRRRKRLRAN